MDTFWGKILFDPFVWKRANKLGSSTKLDKTNKTTDTFPIIIYSKLKSFHRWWCFRLSIIQYVVLWKWIKKSIQFLPNKEFSHNDWSSPTRWLSNEHTYLENWLKRVFVTQSALKASFSSHDPVQLVVPMTQKRSVEEKL